MKSACRCREVAVLRAPEALDYASAHLTLLPAPASVGGPPDRYGPHGWSEWRCPGTGTRWHGNQWGPETELRRRPHTSSSDYLDHGVITARSDEVNAAMAEVDRSVTVDPERHGRATERLWRALEALYSPEWEQILERLRVGEPGAIEPAVVFLETDARCHRSGYTKEQLCRYLRRMDLPDVARQRLRAITPAAVGDPRRPERERRAWRLLADSLDAG